MLEKEGVDSGTLQLLMLITSTSTALAVLKAETFDSGELK
jgi:hypothetical protein